MKQRGRARESSAWENTGIFTAHMKECKPVATTRQHAEVRQPDEATTLHALHSSACEIYFCWVHANVSKEASLLQLQLLWVTYYRLQKSTRQTRASRTTLRKDFVSLYLSRATLRACPEVGIRSGRRNNTARSPNEILQ